MIYARTENGIVTDTLRVAPHTIFPSAYASQFAEAPNEVQRGWSFDGGDYTAPPAPPPTIPQVVTMRQARLALLGAGLLSGVSTAIAGLAEPTKSAAQIEWEYANEVQRNSGLVPEMAAALGLTPAQIDALFIAAEKL